MIHDLPTTFEGGCTCRSVRYRLLSRPMFVNCCHCRWCQRETGTAFALNALIESERVELLSGEIETVKIPSNSGRGQRIARCPSCKIAVWSNYGGAKDRIRFVRVGTLDNPDLFPPSAHIYTESKQPWVELSLSGPPAFSQYYDSAKVWSKESLERWGAVFDKKASEG